MIYILLQNIYKKFGSNFGFIIRRCRKKEKNILFICDQVYMLASVKNLTLTFYANNLLSIVSSTIMSTLSHLSGAIRGIKSKQMHSLKKRCPTSSQSSISHVIWYEVHFRSSRGLQRTWNLQMEWLLIYIMDHKKCIWSYL